MANGDSPANKGALSNLLLPAALAALAIAVAILAWIVFARLDEFEARLDRLDEAHSEIMAAVEKLVTKKHFDKRIDELEDLITRCCKGGSPRLEVMFENAGLKGASSLNEDSPGIALSHEQGEKLDKLAAALRVCAEGDDVHLKVQGYSSTQPFKGAGAVLINSDELNLDAANLRAAVVIRRLAASGAVRGNNVHIHHDPWPNFPAMQRPFKDANGFSKTAQEQLNRVVYIDLQDAGGCERTT